MFLRTLPCVLFVWLGMAHAQTANLSGRVISAAEPRMEGVLVSAKKTGSNITHTVVSGDKGQFTFAAAKLDTGRYAITIRAVGYELEAPVTADAGTGKPLELKLIKAKDLASQLTNSEWFISMPGSFEQKRPLMDCMSCHPFEKIARTTYGADEMYKSLGRMATYAINTSMEKSQKRAVPLLGGAEEGRGALHFPLTP